MQLITNAQKFADLFNAKVPGAHRQITVDDVRDMTTCGLIGRYSYYIHLDIETVRSILRYEKLREYREKRDDIKDGNGVIHCRGCGVALDARPKNKRGRPNEYCAECEPFRRRERNRKWRIKHRAIAMS